jgi:hypothetical protein
MMTVVQNMTGVWRVIITPSDLGINFIAIWFLH